MLNLTNSFYRYLWLTYENVLTKKSYANSFSHHICYWTATFRNKLFVISSARGSTLIESNQRCRFYATKKSRINIKKVLCEVNESKKEKPMNHSLQPTTSHVSYGGQFQITDTGEEQAAVEPYAGGGESPRQPGSRIPPNFRIWEPVRKTELNADSGFKFRIVSYNVLAQYLLESHSYLYTACSPKDLKWTVRAARLYEEIKQLEPDILCLQEVQENHLNSFYDKFKDLGYCGVFKQKTGHRQDGCAIYFKESVFSLQDYITVEYFQPQLPILNRDNIALIVKLIPKCNPGSPLIVATTHLLFNPRRTDVRLAQLQLLLAEIDRFSFTCKDNVGSHLPVIVTGDFNSLPDSAVIQLLNRGYVRVESFRDASDWKIIGITDNCQHLAVLLDRNKGRPQTAYKNIKIRNTDFDSTHSNEKQIERHQDIYNNLFNNEFVCHSLQLESVYDKIKHNGEHEATTFQDYWVTVDYIYFSRCGNLKLLERLRLPTASECEVLGCLPNEVYGSDHLALGAVFEMTSITLRK